MLGFALGFMHVPPLDREREIPTTWKSRVYRWKTSSEKLRKVELRRRAKTTESLEATRPGISAREIPARAINFQTLGMINTSVIRERFTAVGQDLSDRSRRLLVAAEAKTAGYGGITAASQATGVARSTIGRGLKNLADPGSLSGAVRRPGGGAPALAVTDPTLLENLRQLVEPATMGSDASADV